MLPGSGYFVNTGGRGYLLLGNARGRGVESAEQGVPMPHGTWMYVCAARIARRQPDFIDEGRIVERVTDKALFENPKTERARDFIRNITHHEGRRSRTYAIS